MTAAHLQIVVDWIKNCRSIAVLTGAGISAESGVPTFRRSAEDAHSAAKKDEPTPLWEKYDPTELACAQGFLKKPELVWQWYDWRRQLVEGVEPNAGHLALAQIEKLIAPRPLTIITQNVDRLHHRAGSQNILELHGNIVSFRCFDHGHQASEVPYKLSEPPICNADSGTASSSGCSSKLRPNVVWFGESLNPTTLEASMQAARQCDLFIVIGTSALVQPAISLPYAAQGNGAKLVDINIERTPFSNHADVFLPGKSGTVLPAIVDLAKAHGGAL
ncbi:MAG: Sir2 family NAD-dependent protein deacetylase [Candidatus Obscuribacterales bacterium]|jgi:NAD-dependent deacetylase